MDVTPVREIDNLMIKLSEEEIDYIKENAEQQYSAFEQWLRR